MDLALAFLAGLLGGLTSAGIVSFVAFRKVMKTPQFQAMKQMGSMMGNMPTGYGFGVTGVESQIMGMGNPPKGRGFKKYS